MRTNLPSVFSQAAFDAAIGMRWDETQSRNYPACLQGVIASELHHPVLLPARPMIEFDRRIADSRPDVSGSDALVLASARLHAAQTVLARLCLSSVGLGFETTDERDDAVAGVSVFEKPMDRNESVCESEKERERERERVRENGTADRYPLTKYVLCYDWK
jgi:hypothetical protein